MFLRFLLAAGDKWLDQVCRQAAELCLGEHAHCFTDGYSAQVSGLYILVRLEALEVVKNSTVKVVRALQTLARLCSQLAGVIARHR